MAETKPKLDIFTVLERIDLRDYNYYGSLTDDERKSLSPWILMRWMSLVSNTNLATDAIMNTNDCVNLNFSELSKHPELQWKLLCLASSGSKQRHVFVKPPRGRTKNKRQEALSILYSFVKFDELVMLETMVTDDELRDHLKLTGMTDKEISEFF